MTFDFLLEKLRSDKPALSSILIIIGILLLGMVLGNLAAAGIMIYVGELNMNDFNNINTALINAEFGWWALMLGQGFASLITFILSGIFYWLVVEKKPLAALSFKEIPKPFLFLFVFLIQLCFMPLNGWLQLWNENMTFPASLSGLESYLKNMEDAMAEMTDFLTVFDSFEKMLTGFVVVAILAGIGEELIFRGLIQRKLYIGLKNPHLAIWGAAIIFSAIHMQFYGFLPRTLLGALFGYFYYWTGNIWVPILAHIFNNGFAVVMLYLSHSGTIDQDIEEMEEFPIPVVITSLILTLSLLWIFRKKTTMSSE